MDHSHGETNIWLVLTSSFAKTRTAPVLAGSRCFQQKALGVGISNSLVVENEP